MQPSDFRKDSPSRDNPLWEPAVQPAGRLPSPDERFAEWATAVGVECGPIPEPEEDALYDLTDARVRRIFETFHEGWDRRLRLQGVLGPHQNWGAVGHEHACCCMKEIGDDAIEEQVR